MSAQQEEELLLPADTQISKRRRRSARKRCEGRRTAPLARRRSRGIAWPVTPRRESNQATVPAMSSGWDIRPSGTACITSR